MKRTKQKIPMILLVTFLIFTVVFLLQSSLARYVYNGVHNFILESQGFYFNSSVLSVNEASYSVQNWDGVNNYQLTIDVNNQKNELVWTNSDISYEIEVECSDQVTCTTNKTSGTIQKDSKRDSYVITITPNRSISVTDKITVKTTATSISPYRKSLSATYEVGVESLNFSYEIKDSVNSKFLKLRLTNSVSYYEVLTPFGSYATGDTISLEQYKLLSEEEKKNCFSAEITLSFPADQIFLDVTNKTYLGRLSGSETVSTIDGNGYISGYQFRVPANSNTEILFYKKEIARDYTYPFTNPSSVIQVKVKTAA